MGDAAEGSVSVLVVASLDRLGRTVTTAPRIIEALLDAGVTIYAAAQGTRPVLESPALPVLLSLAMYEEEYAEDIKS
jgi:DNA invertase Pin-like site-specific DNA recombinase